MKRNGLATGLSKVLSVIVSFVMIFGTIPTIALAAPGQTYTYQKATSLTGGTTYVIVVESGGHYYAMTNVNTDGYMGAQEVAVSGDYMTSAAGTDVQWLYTSSGSTLKNGSNYLVRSNYQDPLQLKTSTSGYSANWSYNNSTHRLSLGSGSHYLTYSASGLYVPSSGSNVYLYTQVSKTLDHITVTAPPSKTTYTDLEAFDTADMAVTATFNDGTTEPISFTYTPTGALPVSTTSMAISATFNGTTKTTTQAVTVNPALPTIGTQPADINEFTGETNSLTVAAASPDSGTLAYQWYSNPNNTTYSGTSLGSGARSATYTPSSTAAGTTYYYCVVTNTKSTETATANTRIATVTVSANPQAPGITGQPVDITETTGGTQSLSVVASVTDGGTLSYKWYNNGSNTSTYTGSLIPGATGASYQPLSSTAGVVNYYCVVTNSKTIGSTTRTTTANTRIALVTVNPQAPNIGTEPADINEFVGDTTALAVSATSPDGGTLAYQWFSNPDAVIYGGTSLGPGARSASYTPSSASADTKYYYCVVSNTKDGRTTSANTRIASVSVVTLPLAPSINSQPSNLTEYVGDTGYLAIGASLNGSGMLSYQWYSNPDAGTYNGTPISGATWINYQPPASAAGTTYYYCVVTNTKMSGTNPRTATANTSIATVVVNPNPLAPTIDNQPSNINEFAGDTQNLTVSASSNDGGTLSYQWYDNGSDPGLYGGTAITGAINASYQPPSSEAGTNYYYCVVGNAKFGTKKATVNSNIVSVAVTALPQTPIISTEPSDTSEFVGDTLSLSIAASVTDGGAITYQWFSNPDGVTRNGTLLPGETGVSYQPSSSLAGTSYFYCVVTNTKTLGTEEETAQSFSRIAVFTVTEPPVAPAIHTEPSDISEFVGDGGELTVGAGASGGGTLSYQWFSNPDNTTYDGTIIPGETGASYRPASTSAGTAYYYCEVANSKTTDAGTQTAGPVRSRIATVAVTELPQTPSIDTEPSDIDEYAGDAQLLTVVASREGEGTLSYQWYDNGSNTSTYAGTPITGATGASWEPTASGYYYCVVTNTKTFGGADETATKNTRIARVYITGNPHAPSVDTEPDDVIEFVGDTQALSIAASRDDDGTLSYQWYSNPDGTTPGGTVLTGETNASFTPGSSPAGTAYYYCVVTNTKTVGGVTRTAQVISRIAMVTATDGPHAPHISAGPSDIDEFCGDTNPLTVTASRDDDGTLSYQWYSNPDGTTPGGTALTGETSASFTPGSSTAGTAYYYCVVTNAKTTMTGTRLETATSGIATVSVTELPQTPSIDVEPTDIDEFAGDAQYLTVIASREGEGTLSYQWFSNPDASTYAGILVTGATGASWEPTASGYYYCVVTNTKTFGSVDKTAVRNSRIARVYITGNPLAPNIDTEPSNISEFIGDALPLTVTASRDDDGTLTYQWYSSPDGTAPGTALTGKTDAGFTPDSAAAGTAYYYCVVTNSKTVGGVTKLAEASSRIAEVTVTGDPHRPAIDTQPSNINEYVGDMHALTVAASRDDGGTLSYQWYSNPDAATCAGTAIPSATGPSYTPPTASAGTAYYYCAVTNSKTTDTGTRASEPVNSAIATVTVQDVLLESIAVTQNPAKMNYIEYEKFDSDGIVVTAHYNNGDDVDVTGSCTFSDYHLAIGDNTINITYLTESTTLTVHAVAKSLQSISITNPPEKEEYIEGESFNNAGMIVTAHYDNDTSGIAAVYTWAPDGELAASDTFVTVSYTEGSVTRTAVQHITVQAKGSLQITVKDSTGAAFPGIGISVYNNADLAPAHFAGSGVSAATGLVQVTGLDEGEYWIVLTSVPAGFHMPATPIKIPQTVSYGAPTLVNFVLPKSAVYAFNNRQLQELRYTAGTLAPAFDPEQTKYTLTLGETTRQTTITPIPADSTSKLYINGRRVATKTVTLANTGSKTTVRIKVQPKSGRALTYTVTVQRAKSTNAKLSGIKTSRGTALNAAFDPAVTSYSIELRNTQSSVKITTKAQDKYAHYKLTIAGKRVSSTIKLKPDETKTLTITVTPQAGTAYAATYTIAIHRAISHDATLKSLKASRGELVPEFDPGADTYALVLTSAQSSVTLTPKTADTYAKYVITVNGKKVGRTISLAKGETKEVKITVTAQAGEVKTYSITIVRGS